MQTTIKSFSSLNITIDTENEVFTGKKKEMEDVLDKQIIIHDYKLRQSKFPDKYSNDKCLMMQIEMDGRKWVLFSASKYLQAQIEQVGRERLPMITTIKKQDKKLFFT